MGWYHPILDPIFANDPIFHPILDPDLQLHKLPCETKSRSKNPGGNPGGKVTTIVTTKVT